MYETEIYDYVKKLKISNFRGVRMSDELPSSSKFQECGILNFEAHNREGTHWVAWYKKGRERIYFDSYAGLPPLSLVAYLKTDRERELDQAVIKRSMVTVQRKPMECGALCLYVLFRLSRDPFPEILLDLKRRRTGPLIC